MAISPNIGIEFRFGVFLSSLCCFIRLLICNHTNYILHDFGQYNQASKLLATKFRLVNALFALILLFFPQNMVHDIEMCVMWVKTVFKIQSTIRFSCHQNDINQHWFLPWLVVTLESHLQIKHGWISHNQVMSTGCILSAYQTTISYQNIFMFYMKLNLKNWLTLSTFLRFISMLLT